jgi:hypothetical protein
MSICWPAPGRGPLVQRGQDRRDRVDAGEDVGDRDAGFLRLAVGLAGDRHQAGHALDDEIVAGAMGIGPGLAEAGDRAIDQPRVHRREAVVVEPVFRQPADLEVLDHHIGAGDQVADLRLAVRRAEIDHPRGLAAVGGMEIGGRDIVAAGDEGRTPGAGVIAFGLSILITSAPRSDRVWPAQGPARIRAISMTLSPASGPGRSFSVTRPVPTRSAP